MNWKNTVTATGPPATILGTVEQDCSISYRHGQSDTSTHADSACFL